MSEHKLYFSDRGHPLITTKVFDVPVATVENYCKWYNIHILHPDGTVEAVDGGIILQLNDLIRHHGWIDHVYHPELLLAIGEYYGGCVDNQALELVAGRWVMEEHSLGEGKYFLDDDVIEKIKAFRNKEKGI